MKENIKDKELEMYLKMLKELRIKIITSNGKCEYEEDEKGKSK